MKEKTSDYYYSIGCGTVLLLFLIGFFTLVFIWNREPPIPIERDAVGYIIEHVDEFKDEINAIGYEVRVAYTLGDVWGEDFEENEYNNKQKKVGYEDRGILILSNDKEEYRFDIGFDWYGLYREDGINITMSKDYYFKDEVLDLRKKDDCPVNVAIAGNEIKEKYESVLYNDYNIDFIKFREQIGDERMYDKQIKKYISAEELRAIYERCIGLQEKLVELYKAKNG